jgi:hypothetical protein
MFPSSRDVQMRHRRTPRESELSLQAKSICSTCPIQKECLKMAIDNRERYGIWGGVDFGCREERDIYISVRMDMNTSGRWG